MKVVVLPNDFVDFLNSLGVIIRSLNKKPHLATVLILHIAKGILILLRISEIYFLKLEYFTNILTKRLSFDPPPFQ